MHKENVFPLVYYSKDKLKSSQFDKLKTVFRHKKRRQIFTKKLVDDGSNKQQFDVQF